MRKSFVVYFDNIEQFEMLTDEQRGVLFLAMCHFARDGKDPEFSDPVLKIAFSFLRGQMLRDAEKYEESCRKNAENGKKGGRPKKTKEETETVLEKTDRFFEKPKKANSDSDSESDNDVDNGVCDTAAAHTNDHTHTKKTVELSANDLTVDIVRQMAQRQCLSWSDDECRRFIDYNRDAGRTSGWDYAVKQWERNRPRFERTSWTRKKKQLSQQELDELNEYMELSNRFEEVG